MNTLDRMRELTGRRIEAHIPGRLLCVRASIDRGRLSDLENGYIEPSTAELERLKRK